jgi:hypothetical protein
VTKISTMQKVTKSLGDVGLSWIVEVHFT